MRFFLVALFFVGCASMPPTAKLIEQATLNEQAIDEIEDSDLPEPVKARAVKAIQQTQKLAIQASESAETCKASLANAEKSKYQWSGVAGLIGAVIGFFIRGRF